MSSKLIQLYAWYPVKGGCPHCGKGQNIPTPQEWIRGMQTTALTKCSECQGAYYVRIAQKKGSKMVPVDLTKLPNSARPEAYECEALAEDGIVLLPKDLISKGGDA